MGNSCEQLEACCLHVVVPDGSINMPEIDNVAKSRDNGVEKEADDNHKSKFSFPRLY